MESWMHSTIGVVARQECKQTHRIHILVDLGITGNPAHLVCTCHAFSTNHWPVLHIKALWNTQRVMMTAYDSGNYQIQYSAV
jgi:hypothetical protein